MAPHRQPSPNPLRPLLAPVLAALLLSGCACRAGNPLRVATATASHALCSDIFVSGQDPKHSYEEFVDAEPGYAPVRWAFSHEVDRDRREVRVRVFGALETRSAYRDGLGCLNVLDDKPADAPAPAELDVGDVAQLLPDLAGPEVVEPTEPRLKGALDAAFAEPDGQPFRRTRAVVVVHHGRVVAERYGDGCGVSTPLHGTSATKAVFNALVGILVGEGRLAVDAPVSAPAWRSPGDPRRDIRVDHLLRMTSGLDLGNSLSFGVSTGWDPAARALYLEPDMAGFSEGAPLDHSPGSTWSYANGNYHILARLVRDAAGGRARDVLRFARRELFAPLGMRHVTLELDSTGTPIGGIGMFAPAREWAQFGLLFLNDGVVGSQRLLPEGWVRRSTTLTPNGWGGHAAGWWTNQGTSELAQLRVKSGMPQDAFMASGSLGQFVVVVPSEDLVIARFGASRYADPEQAMGEISRLVSDVIAALR